MKFETKLNKILKEENKEVKKLKLINFAFKLMPNSPQQNKVKDLINTI